MSLTRYLPIPSDRMGILWTLLSMDDAIILEYGTAGTTAYASKMLGFQGLPTHGKLFTTGMSEDNVVMGDTRVLEEMLVELDKTHQPKAIFVMASSASSIIGADIKGVCNAMTGRVQAKIIPFTQGGFGGDYSKGRQIAYTTLVNELATQSFPTEDCYNVIGAGTDWHRGDMDCIQRMMTDQFGLQPNALLCYKTSLTAIAQLSKVRVNLVLSYEGLDSAKTLEKQFGIPYVYGLPLGIGGTKKWLDAVSKAVDMPLKNAQIYTTQPIGTGKSMVIYADYDKALALGRFAQELGYTVTHTITPHKPPKGAQTTYFKTETEKITFFKGLEHTMILGDDTFAPMANSSNQYHCVHALPLDTTRPIPLLGIEGAKGLCSTFFVEQ